MLCGAVRPSDGRLACSVTPVLQRPREYDGELDLEARDDGGYVEIDKLSKHERIDYLFARALGSRDYSFEIVTALDD